MENNEVAVNNVNNEVVINNEIDKSKLPAFKVKVYGTDNEEIKMDKFSDLVDVRFWLPITYSSFVRLLMHSPEWELLSEDGNLLSKGRNHQFGKAKPVPIADEISKFADVITWALGGAFTEVMEMTEEKLSQHKPTYLRLIFDRISDTVFSYADFELCYIEKPIMIDGKRLFAPLVKTPVSSFALEKGANGGVIMRKFAYEKWERLLEEDDGEDIFKKMVLDPLNMIKLGTQQAFTYRFHNSVRFNRWYSMPLFNCTNVLYVNTSLEEDIFKRGRYADEKPHTYSNNPNTSNFYIFYIEKNELKMVKMDAKYYEHLNKAEVAK